MDRKRKIVSGLSEEELGNEEVKILSYIKMMSDKEKIKYLEQKVTSKLKWDFVSEDIIAVLQFKGFTSINQETPIGELYNYLKTDEVRKIFINHANQTFPVNKDLWIYPKMYFYEVCFVNFLISKIVELEKPAMIKPLKEKINWLWDPEKLQSPLEELKKNGFIVYTDIEKVLSGDEIAIFIKHKIHKSIVFIGIFDNTQRVLDPLAGVYL